MTKNIAEIEKQARTNDANMLPSFVPLFKKTSPSVVNISATLPLPFPNELLPQRDKELLSAMVRSLGSGFVIDNKGHVVTCLSVVTEAKEIEVILHGGRRLQAKLVGSDEISDIALLSIPREQSPPPLLMGKLANLKIGDWVAAFGYPFGLSHSISAGVVSAIRTGQELKQSHGLILVDAFVNPGCNGGPLLDLGGKVVGINLIAGNDQSSMGLALPIDDALSVIESLKSGQSPKHPWIGISVQHVDIKLATSFGMKESTGALVSKVEPGGPAQKAGIKIGDIITSFAGHIVEDPVALVDSVLRVKINIKIDATIFRKGKTLVLTIIPKPKSQ